MKRMLLIVAFVLLTPFSIADSTQGTADHLLMHIQDNLQCMATAIYHESKGEGYVGMLAVAHVVNNRMRSTKYPSNACGVIGQPGQFPWFKKKPKISNETSYSSSLSIAWDVLVGNTKDPTNGATMFHSVNEFPDWRKPVKTKIRNHIFY